MSFCNICYQEPSLSYYCLRPSPRLFREEETKQSPHPWFPGAGHLELLLPWHSLAFYTSHILMSLSSLIEISFYPHKALLKQMFNKYLLVHFFFSHLNLNLHLFYTMSPSYHISCKECINRKSPQQSGIHSWDTREMGKKFGKRGTLQPPLGSSHGTLNNYPSGKKLTSFHSSQDYASLDCFPKMQHYKLLYGQANRTCDSETIYLGVV